MPKVRQIPKMSKVSKMSKIKANKDLETSSYRTKLAPTVIALHHVEAMMQSFHVGPVTVPAENNESNTAV